MPLFVKYTHTRDTRLTSVSAKMSISIVPCQMRSRDRKSGTYMDCAQKPCAAVVYRFITLCNHYICLYTIEMEKRVQFIGQTINIFYLHCCVIYNVTDVTGSFSHFVSYIIEYRLSEYTKY